MHEASPQSIAPMMPASQVPRIRGELENALARAESQMTPEASALVQLALCYVASVQHQIATQQALIGELETLSVTDPLTGLLNRRGFQSVLSRCLAEAERHDEQGLLFYLDLDGFKVINDMFGHPTGDALLCYVAELLKRNIRSTDYAARLGGDEFAVVFPRTTVNSLKPILSKLRGCLNGGLVEIHGHRLTISASIGCASFGHGTEVPRLLAAADRAMYRRKNRRTRRAA